MPQSHSNPRVRERRVFAKVPLKGVLGRNGKLRYECLFQDEGGKRFLLFFPGLKPRYEGHTLYMQDMAEVQTTQRATNGFDEVIEVRPLGTFGEGNGLLGASLPISNNIYSRRENL